MTMINWPGYTLSPNCDNGFRWGEPSTWYWQTYYDHLGMHALTQSQPEKVECDEADQLERKADRHTEIATAYRDLAEASRSVTEAIKRLEQLGIAISDDCLPRFGR